MTQYTITIALLVFIIAIANISLVFIINPMIIWLTFLLKQKKILKNYTIPYTPFVSVIIVVHNEEKIISQKLDSIFNLDYPKDKMEIIVYSDGSSDNTNMILSNIKSKYDFLFLSEPTQKGKNYGLNRAVLSSKGEILVFTDASGILARDAVQKLILPLQDTDVCGVCGNLVVGTKAKLIGSAQQNYFQLDSILKNMESRIDSITSNLGALYAIKRFYFQPFAEAVTDDLYACLNILKQHKRFVYAPEASVYVEATSKDWQHELKRRKRIVTGSLECMYVQISIFNFFRYGMISVRLFINKLLRRLLPISLILLFLSSIILSQYNLFLTAFTMAQMCFYLLALSHVILSKINYFLFSKQLLRVTGIAYYFVIGNIGMLLGFIDFVKGKKVAMWQNRD